MMSPTLNFDSEPNSVGRGLSVLKLHDGTLNIETALHGGDGAAEFGEESVAGGPNDPAAVFFHFEKVHLFAQPAQSRKCQRLIALHQAAETGDVGKHDRGKLANGLAVLRQVKCPDTTRDPVIVARVCAIRDVSLYGCEMM